MVLFCTVVLLYLCFGALGLHQLYLKRPFHAFIHYTSLGGWGFLLLYDFMNLNRYVSGANIIEGNMNVNQQDVDSDDEDTPTYLRYTNRSKWQLHRLLAEILFGSYFSFWCFYAFPDDLESLQIFRYYLIPPASVAFGVWLTGNVGDQSVGFRHCLIGATLGLPWMTMGVENWSSMYASVFSAFVATAGSHRFKTLDQMRAQRLSYPRTFAIFIGLCCLWNVVFVSTLLNNCTVSDAHGNTIRFREAFVNFIRSDFLSDAWHYVRHLLPLLWQGQWHQAFHFFRDNADLSGERRALKTLGLNDTSTLDEISSICRRKLADSHPDRYSDPDEKINAEQIFIAFSNACRLLKQIRRL